MNDSEVVMQRRQTDAFIRADSTVIRFERHVTRRNARGGTQIVSTGLIDAQTVRFVRAVLRRRRVALESTNAGQMWRSYDRLICYHNADIKAGDEFDFEGQHWVVQKILPRVYQISADVELRDGEIRN